MRVKLSYTVEEEDVLKESSKIVGLCAEDVQQCVVLFQELQKELAGTSEEDAPPNVSKALDMMEEFRKALLAVDTRLIEVTDIVTGYEDYKMSNRKERAEAAVEPLPPKLPSLDE
tara:strand:- start:562 stop:906 length:345 start_codon:yes stop_codon:yes gene_type:complete